jgi:hypothetical protein
VTAAVGNGEVTTFGSLHGGDIVLGQDGNAWGVEYVSRKWGAIAGPAFEVCLVRHGARVTGWPDESASVTVVQRADTALEAGAYTVLTEAGLNPEVISERWTDVQE